MLEIVRHLADLGWRAITPYITAISLLTCIGCDQHHSVTKEMGWQCTGTADTGNQTYPHVEGVKLWFLENPRYEERASGPSLCADLNSSGQPTVAVTFDVWGNRMQGLHGYDLTGITLGSKALKLYSSESGGYHGDPRFGNFDSKADEEKHPEKYRFPLNVYK
jgi:hypothetical protein